MLRIVLGIVRRVGEGAREETDLVMHYLELRMRSPLGLGVVLLMPW